MVVVMTKIVITNRGINIKMEGFLLRFISFVRAVSVISIVFFEAFFCFMRIF